MRSSGWSGMTARGGLRIRGRATRVLCGIAAIGLTLGFSRGARTRTRVALLATLAVGLRTTALPAASFASSAPQIGGTSVEIVETSATLTAQIRPEGLETKYELWLEGEPTAAEVGEGQISASRLEQEVSAHLASLKPSHAYTYWLVASNKAGTRTSIPASFTTEASASLPHGTGGGPPYVFEEEPWNKQGAERAGAEAPALEAARQAKRAGEERAAKEAAERPAKEAAERAAKEREAREAGERIGREAAERAARLAASSHCIVPRLNGDSLAAAQSALHKVHCRLGKVSKPRGHHGALVVTTQSVRAGRKLAKGTGVAVKLGPVPKTRRG